LLNPAAPEAPLTCELTPASHRLLNPAAPEAPLC